MPRFFAEISGKPGDPGLITGEDAAHITRSLRMHAGDSIEVSDGRGTDYFCEILATDPSYVQLKILETSPSASEPAVHTTLYVAAIKGEKMDFLIQKAVELGVSEIVPMITKRCVNLPDEKSAKNKLQRWNKIALEASKQSGRGRIPTVGNFVDFREAVRKAAEAELPLLAYEKALTPLRPLLEATNFRTASLMTGPEGGLEESEVREAREAGLRIVSLGKRILRAETAPLYVLSVLSYSSEQGADGERVFHG